MNYVMFSGRTVNKHAIVGSNLGLSVFHFVVVPLSLLYYKYLVVPTRPTWTTHTIRRFQWFPQIHITMHVLNVCTYYRMWLFYIKRLVYKGI